jgi:hypothetical protein
LDPNQNHDENGEEKPGAFRAPLKKGVAANTLKSFLAFLPDGLAGKGTNDWK